MLEHGVRCRGQQPEETADETAESVTSTDGTESGGEAVQRSEAASVPSSFPFRCAAWIGAAAGGMGRRAGANDTAAHGGVAAVEDR